MPKHILGIDVSKSKFDIALLLKDTVKTKKFTNNSEGFLALADWLDEKEITELHACMEATGNYGDALATYLFNIGYLVSVVNPAQIKGFSKSELSRTKTDKADAKLIARFCKAMEPKAWKPKPQHIYELQTLIRRVEALQDLYRQEMNRLEVAPPLIKTSIKTISDKIFEEIQIIKSRICECIDKNSDLREKKNLLQTIPGIAETTTAQILAFIGNPQEFRNAKQLAAFIGLNPKLRQSGTSVNGRTFISKTGDSNLRKAFYMPALVAKKHNPVIRDFCERLKKSGKPPMVIVCAAMRKLIHIIYGVLKSGKPFNANLVAL